jgi:integrase
MCRCGRRRDELINPPCSEYFLVAERGGRLLPQYVSHVFLRLSRQIGLRAPNASSGPRIHDFRHSFAVIRYCDGIELEKR